MTITVKPLHPEFVAQILGVDLRQPVDARTVAAITEAINRYAVLVFPGQMITDQQQMAFSRNFGELETTVRAYRKDFVPRLDLHMADISNLGPDNRILPKADRLWLDGLGNRLWHSDSSFKRVPARFSLLSARVIPNQGGETQFADMRAAWDALSDRMKARVEGLVCEHSQLFSRGSIGFCDWSEEERARMAPVPQVLVRTHPGSGRKSLFLSSHAGRIRGMPDPEARLLLMDLTEHATQRAFAYTHRWVVGDLVMWDNRCTMHRSRPYDETQVRDLRRTTVSDDVPTVVEAAA
ncbi:TauD/TfdA dioxygenase family protein [Rhodopila globiformis]|uniref:2,4-dichlorophenoxyacetate dioxygenase n=1 Tax=Rhodopila globiformis TaxID=1071 RepID=A0A2S6NB55_RHOGL|nr:TauD/TfdA family dioxygenase [Rhodopila globiformis]PPQ31824.1 2,4-dichlorophenoxyacetate dioxygenase [Rhodopila globiformis]